MAILEKIRKRTTVLILIIGMALFAFVISGIFTGNGGMGLGKIGSSVGEVNGETISIDQFRQEMEAVEGRFGPQTTSTQIVNSVWDQMVRKTLLGQEFDRLGIDIGTDQIMDLIRTNPSFTQNPQFQDQNGNFDEDAFRNFITDLSVNQPDQYQAWLQSEAALIQASMEQTYFDLVRAGVGATLKEGELDYHMANDKVDIRYVRVPYTSIADSTINISKSDIEKYMKAHEEEYQQAPGRDIRYVYFEEKASEADQAAIRESLVTLLEDREEYRQDLDSTVTVYGFSHTPDMAAFLDLNSDTKYDTLFKSRNDLPAVVADTLMGMETGEIYGPYRDGEYFKISRIMDRKDNGSVKASHILVAYQGAMRANPAVTRTQEEAEARARELLAEARGDGAVFAQLARDNSDGPSAQNGGDLGYFQEGVMTAKFNDFAFQNPTGTIGLVETEFGYHIVKIDDKQDIIRVATLSRMVEPSEETINATFTEATSFEMAVSEAPTSYGSKAEEMGYSVRPVNKLQAMDENLPGLGAQRRVVQWAFNPETETGDVRRFDLAGGYAVVQLTAKYREGLMSVEDASAQILPKLRRERKAGQIMAANQGKSLEDIASANNVTIASASALNAKTPTIAGAGREPMVVGTAVSLGEGDTSGLIQGETGVFKLQVTAKQAAPALENYAPYAGTLTRSIAPRVNTSVYDALKEKAEIEDERATYF
ncbi:SurA N-terminal domain-containing protein [Robiginitalea sp. M366]|uniref:peptidylprolyl isomerase n=1 Tax=Robiginitalea aestuariiviva TaxID=3036903 RepID=UPI00240D4493|nr:SurA N-terminal domain-containing protein [Robiginitalea aestuariiviva]MDG1571873.1 SurA N-terminal domain-containing protein [Robiginitalea aestuariiviva]